MRRDEKHSLQNSSTLDLLAEKRYDEDFLAFELDQFSIYKPDEGNRPLELAPLHHLCTKNINGNYLFNGVLSLGSVKCYVQKVPFRIVSIGNYCEPSLHGVGDQLWIQSIRAQQQHSSCWYHLKSPAPEYRHYHDQFLWLANSAKYFTEFMQLKEVVRLSHLRRYFFTYLQDLHGQDEDFQSWLKEYDC